MAERVPGVYIREIPTLPPSVAPVATAIPAFVGYTEIAKDDDGNQVTGEDIVIGRITSFVEYQTQFGKKPKYARFVLTENGDEYDFVRKQPTGNDDAPILHSHLMYYAIQAYFANGGGPCYVVSVGRYSSSINPPDSDTIAIDQILAGIEALNQKDEPTLIILADGPNVGGLSDDPSPLYQAYVQVMAQCRLLKDRFGIFDVLETDTDASAFRESTGSDNLKYGAAYAPFIQTLLNYKYNQEDIEVGIAFRRIVLNGDNGLVITYPDDNPASDDPMVEVVAAEGDEISFDVTEANKLTILGVGDGGTPAQELVNAWNSSELSEGSGFVLSNNGEGTEAVVEAEEQAITRLQNNDLNLSAIRDSYTNLYNQFVRKLSRQRVVLPPSSLVAGVYARVDRDRGVWKAPANVSLSSVVAPVRNITNEQQGRLNIDPTSGKSINAIRSFTGKGTLIWGARTLAGNDNEWRYVNVRRLFIFIEESIQKATEFVVFEPNTATTWLKVKGLIESFLYGLWQQGALAGPTADAAYFVNVGLGKTMTQDDVLNGKLIVDVGIAAVRPAEFIILRFSHKLQEA